MRRRYVLKNKRRFALVLMLLTLITIFTGLIVNAGATSGVRNTYQTFQVAKGDTLWRIASIHSDNSDIRAYIYDMKLLNKLKTDDINIGQVLLLP